MKLISVIIEWGKGLLASGNIIAKLLGLLGVIIGMVLATVFLILQFGLRPFVIFWDETQFYSSKGLEYLKQISLNLNNLLIVLIYYFNKQLHIIDSGTFPNPIKQKFKSVEVRSIISNSCYAFFYYSLGLVIFIISIYWLFTYVEFLFYLSQLIVSEIGFEISILTSLSGLIKYLEKWSLELFSLNLFGFYIIWIVRVFGFCSIFISRFLRLKALHPSLQLNDILPYRNPFWKNQATINTNFKRSYKPGLRVLVVFLIGFIVILIINQLFISNKLQKNEIGKIGIASTITNPKTIIGESFHDSISYPETLEDEKIKDTNTINSQKEPLRNKQKPFIEQLSENDTIGNNAFCIINDENEIMDISLSFDGYQYQTFSLKPKQPNYFVFWNYSNHYFVHTEGHLRVCTLATDSCVGVIMALSKKYKIRWNKKKKRQDIFFAFFSVDFQPRSPVECLLNNKTMTGCPSFPG